MLVSLLMQTACNHVRYGSVQERCSQYVESFAALTGVVDWLIAGTWSEGGLTPAAGAVAHKTQL